jgi:hypothetical protein
MVALPNIPNPDIVSFYDDTRLKRIPLPTVVKPAGGGLQVIQLPQNGLARGIQCYVTVVVTGTPDEANPLGMASVFRSIRLRTNGSVDIFEASGADYTYAINEQLNTELFPGMVATYNQGASAVAAGTFRLDFYIPIAMNARDPIGLFNLQNREINVSLELQFEADTTVTGGATATYTATVVPILEFFTLPSNDDMLPPFDLVHQFTSESRVISGAGDLYYAVPTGQIWLSIAYGAYWAQSAAVSWSRFQEKVGASDSWMDEVPGTLQGLYSRERGRTVRDGTIIRDFMASAGGGMLSQTDRDAFDTLLVSQFQHILTLTGAGTLRIVKRQLVRVNSN